MQDKSPEGSGLQAGGREWIGLAVLALPTLLLALDISVLFLDPFVDSIGSCLRKRCARR